MKSIEAIYLLFAVAHPVSELIRRTNLRIFLNEEYYRTKRDDFPVNKIAGVGGSLLVLAILIAPLLAPLILRLHPESVEILWYLAFGLVLADLVQHAIHFVAHPQNPAPLVHLVTIVGVLVPLLFIVKPGGPLLFGTLLILGNWANNSRLARHRTGIPEGQMASPAV